MHIAINREQFHQIFRDVGKQYWFTHEALDLLFNHLEQFEDYELDALSLCDEFEEYFPEDVAHIYELPSKPGEALSDTVRKFLEASTIFVGQTQEGAFVYASF